MNLTFYSIKHGVRVHIMIANFSFNSNCKFLSLKIFENYIDMVMVVVIHYINASQREVLSFFSELYEN